MLGTRDATEVPAELLGGETGIDQIAQGHLGVGSSLKLDVEQDFPTPATEVGEEEHVGDALVKLFGEKFVRLLP